MRCHWCNATTHLREACPRLHLDRVEAKLDTHDEYFVVLIKMMNDYSKKMDENQEEIRRLFGVKDEQHSSDLKGLGEGVRSNRERLDEHEGRLEDLEAS